MPGCGGRWKHGEAMKLVRATGRVEGVRYIASPNCDARPPEVEIDVLVIHAISLPPGEFGGPAIEALFCNRLDPAAHPYFATVAALRVSAHFLIRRSGATLQFVPVTDRAWHAGASCCLGRPRVNDFSIGIELEGSDERPFEDAQYHVLAALSRCLMAAYPAITPDHVFGHCDIAPERKTDPGPCFDWARYARLLGVERLGHDKL